MYVGFDKLKGELAHRSGVTNPGALAAAIGRKKYGPAAMRKAAATGHSLRNARPLSGGPSSPIAGGYKTPRPNVALRRKLANEYGRNG